MTLATSGTTWLTAAEWLAVLRIGLGVWWFESFRHKDKAAWFQRGAGAVAGACALPRTLTRPAGWRAHCSRLCGRAGRKW